MLTHIDPRRPRVDNRANLFAVSREPAGYCQYRCEDQLILIWRHLPVPAYLLLGTWIQHKSCYIDRPEYLFVRINKPEIQATGNPITMTLQMEQPTARGSLSLYRSPQVRKAMARSSWSQTTNQQRFHLVRCWHLHNVGLNDVAPSARRSPFRSEAARYTGVEDKVGDQTAWSPGAQLLVQGDGLPPANASGTSSPPAEDRPRSHRRSPALPVSPTWRPSRRRRR